MSLGPTSLTHSSRQVHSNLTWKVPKKDVTPIAKIGQMALAVLELGEFFSHVNISRRVWRWKSELLPDYRSPAEWN